MAQPYEDITLHLDDEIAVLTLNRPEVRNALRHQTFAEIEDAVLHLSARVLIVTGADPAFCAGDDVRAIMGAGEVRERRRHTPRLRSAPAQNARPAPVTMTARTSSSLSVRSNAANSPWIISPVSALSLSGRFSVIVATPSRTL